MSEGHLVSNIQNLFELFFPIMPAMVKLFGTAFEIQFALIFGLLLYITLTTAIPIASPESLDGDVSHSTTVLSPRTRPPKIRSVSVQFSGGNKPTMAKKDYTDIQGGIRMLLQAMLPVLDKEALVLSVEKWTDWPIHSDPTKDDPEVFLVTIKYRRLWKPTTYKGYFWLEDGKVSGDLTVPSHKPFSSEARKMIMGEEELVVGSQVSRGVLVTKMRTRPERWPR
ncbi:hypothetical protein J3R30DRAFT_3462305 [Lentinula aciculospora]|uniref:Uncharacterized protein n=1 Tax=Lentinula aciculospora TaxID=153920 RepID=A0A9W9DQ41_9AGAR|nr:hypothetical protein J3R30DRAFT_3462305 [Lentinula aciculospora]